MSEGTGPCCAFSMDSNFAKPCRDVRCDECQWRDEIYPIRQGKGEWVSAKEYVEDPNFVSLKPDNVYHPTHYSRWKMEPIEFIAINDLPWWLANVIKYTMRFDAKDGLQDLYKARSYLDMKIRQLEEHERFWEKPVAEERALNAPKAAEWPPRDGSLPG